MTRSNAAPGFINHPKYTIDIEPTAAELKVWVGDTLVAQTTKPLRVSESKHHPVWYIPLADVKPDCIEPTATSTHCPFKGDASYWNLGPVGDRLSDAMWGYSTPFDECEALREHVAFYTDRVQLEVDGERLAMNGPGWVDR